MNYECMICTESENKGSLYKPCNCNTLIHKDCLNKLIDVNSHQQKCPICLKEYDIIIISKGYKYNFVLEEFMIFGIIYLLSILLILFSLILIFEFKSNYKYIILITSCGSFISIGLIIFIHVFYYKRTSKICCIDRKVNLIRQINLPSSFSNSNNI